MKAQLDQRDSEAAGEVEASLLELLSARREATDKLAALKEGHHKVKVAPFLHSSSF